LSRWSRLFRRRSLSGFLRTQRLRTIGAYDNVFGTDVVTDDTHDSLGLPSGYRYRVRLRYYDDINPESDVVAQPDVYTAADVIARTLSAKTIVDLGCGKGGKLAPMASRYETIGVDFGGNMEWCRSSYPQGTWIEANLDTALPPIVPVGRTESAVVVSADVIEHLLHPRNLLRGIRAMLDSNALAAVISTPDRVRTRGASHIGPPPNPSHAREWSLDEFRDFVGSELLAARVYRTRANTLDTLGKSVLVVCFAPTVPSIPARGRRAGSGARSG
jgi:hypothetical protein